MRWGSEREKQEQGGESIGEEMKLDRRSDGGGVSAVLSIEAKGASSVGLEIH